MVGVGIFECSTFATAHDLQPHVDASLCLASFFELRAPVAVADDEPVGAGNRYFRALCVAFASGNVVSMSPEQQLSRHSCARDMTPIGICRPRLDAPHPAQELSHSVPFCPFDVAKCRPNGTSYDVDVTLV